MPAVRVPPAIHGTFIQFGHFLQARASHSSHRFTQRREQAEMKKILVAYDGDEPSRLALERGADLALAFGAQLAVINVTPWRNDAFPVDLWDDAGAHRRPLSQRPNGLATGVWRPNCWRPLAILHKRLKTPPRLAPSTRSSSDREAWVPLLAACR